MPDSKITPLETHAHALLQRQSRHQLSKAHIRCRLEDRRARARAHNAACPLVGVLRMHQSPGGLKLSHDQLRQIGEHIDLTCIHLPYLGVHQAPVQSSQSHPTHLCCTHLLPSACMSLPQTFCRPEGDCMLRAIVQPQAITHGIRDNTSTTTGADRACRP